MIVSEPIVEGVVVALVVGIIGLLFRQMLKRLDDLETWLKGKAEDEKVSALSEKFSDYREEAAEKFATRSDIQGIRSEIKQAQIETTNSIGVLQTRVDTGLSEVKKLLTDMMRDMYKHGTDDRRKSS